MGEFEVPENGPLAATLEAPFVGEPVFPGELCMEVLSTLPEGEPADRGPNVVSLFLKSFIVCSDYVKRHFILLEQAVRHF